MSAIEAVYREAYAHARQRARLRPRRVAFRVRFYPYAGLTSTIFKRRDHYEVRLSDILEDAPVRVHFSLALVLLSRIDARYEVTPQEQEPYEAWARRPAVQEAMGRVRADRGSKRTLPPEGDVYDLRRMFRRLNRAYFRARLPEVSLGWSEQEARTRFGHHDEDLGHIVLNRRLDSTDVPERVVEYVLYHEMLHVKHGIGRDDEGRRVMHPKAFKEDERRFDGWREAEAYLSHLASRRTRRRTPNA